MAIINDKRGDFSFVHLLRKRYKWSAYGWENNMLLNQQISHLFHFTPSCTIIIHHLIYSSLNAVLCIHNYNCCCVVHMRAMTTDIEKRETTTQTKSAVNKPASRTVEPGFEQCMTYTTLHQQPGSTTNPILNNHWYMAERCSHADQHRSGVSFTSHLVAIIRAKESKNSNKLFDDPFAENLAGEPGKEWYQARQQTESEKLNTTCAIVSSRTCAIDEQVISAVEVEVCVFQQICFLGAGLDSRPWRIMSDHHLPYFEVDFKEVFEYKLPLIDAVSSFEYIPVTADLSLPDWSEKLTTKGFDSSKTTLWVLEGLTMYLTESECQNLFATVTMLSGKQSRLVVDFFTRADPVFQRMDQKNASSNTHSLFNFMPEHPLQFVTAHGWIARSESLYSYALKYGRSDMIPEHMVEGAKTYVLVTADLADQNDVLNV